MRRLPFLLLSSLAACGSESSGADPDVNSDGPNPDPVDRSSFADDSIVHRDLDGSCDTFYGLPDPVANPAALMFDDNLQPGPCPTEERLICATCTGPEFNSPPGVLAIDVQHYRTDETSPPCSAPTFMAAATCCVLRKGVWNPVASDAAEPFEVPASTLVAGPVSSDLGTFRYSLRSYEINLYGDIRLSVCDNVYGMLDPRLPERGDLVPCPLDEADNFRCSACLFSDALGQGSTIERLVYAPSSQACASTTPACSAFGGEPQP